MNVDNFLDIINIRLNDLLNNREFNSNQFYKFIYNYTLQIQRRKSPDTRINVISIYNSINTLVSNTIINFTKHISNKIVDKVEFLEYYYSQSNLFIKNINIINHSLRYINNELLILESKFELIDYNVLAINKPFASWF